MVFGWGGGLILFVEGVGRSGGGSVCSWDLCVCVIGIIGVCMGWVVWVVWVIGVNGVVGVGGFGFLMPLVMGCRRGVAQG